MFLALFARKVCFSEVVQCCYCDLRGEWQMQLSEENGCQCQETGTERSRCEAVEGTFEANPIITDRLLDEEEVFSRELVLIFLLELLEVVVHLKVALEALLQVLLGQVKLVSQVCLASFLKFCHFLIVCFR